MTNNIPANINPARAPAQQNRLGADLISMYLNRVEETGLGHFSISESSAPAGRDRLALQERRAELNSGFSGSDPREIVERVARLFLRFPSSRLPNEIAKATMASYAQDLSMFPLWAIDRAFMSVIAGQAGTSASFVPSSIELRKACEREIQPVRDEVSDIDKILNAETYREATADEKARVQALFAELRDELNLNADPRDKNRDLGRPSTKEEAEGFLDRVDPSKPPPMFSDALRSKLGMKPAETQEDRQGEAA